MSDDEVALDIPLGFWGTVLSANASKPFSFTPPIGKAIRLSSASLAHNAKASVRASLLVSCPSTSPDSTATPITVTTLSGTHHPSTLLDLYLLGGQEVALQAKGDGDIHVGGYCTVQDIGEEEEEEEEFEDGEGEGYLIDEHQLDDDEAEQLGVGGRWMVRGEAKGRAAKAQAVRSIIDELREEEEAGGDEGEDADELDDSDFIGELLDGEDGEEDEGDEDEGDEDDEEDDAEMYEFGEESEDEASNEELADAIRQQLAGKIRVMESDEDDSEEEKEGRGKANKKQSAKRTADKPVAAGAKAKATAKTAKPAAAAAAAAPKPPAQSNGTAASKKRPVEAQPATPAAAASKKQKSAPATPATPASASTGGAKTIKCTGCDKLFSSEAGMQQHAESKHKAA